MADVIADPGAALALPTGSPQISGLGETFQPDLFTGTGNFGVPLSFPSWLNGLTPEASLGYSSGGGNGHFGMGFRMATLSIARSLRFGFPDYHEPYESQRFVLNDASPIVRVSNDLYRPETDNTFWHIARLSEGWRITTKDGTVYDLGTSHDSRIYDPSKQDQVYRWNISRCTDSFGNYINYRYDQDGSERYLSAIEYGPFKIIITYEARPDITTSRRAGFRIVTSKRAKLITISAADSVRQPIRKYKLIYNNSGQSGTSLLEKIVSSAGEGAAEVHFPELMLSYTERNFAKGELKDFTHESVAPPSLTDGDISLLDLVGDGLPDLIASDPLGIIYWQNLGNNHWGAPRRLKNSPNDVELGSSDIRLCDINGTGSLDLLISKTSQFGYYPNAGNGEFDPYIAFPQPPRFDLNDPRLRFADLNGDGRIDAILSEPNALKIYTNVGDLSFTREITLSRQRDYDAWPDVYFEDPSVRLGDMTGDGLVDIAVIKSGSISYWPAVGIGRWEARVEMINAPRFPRNYRQDNIKLVDIDGSGTNDIVYIGEDYIKIYINRGGREWSDPIVIENLPPLEQASAVIIDPDGRGVASLVISYPPRTASPPAMKVLRFSTDYPGNLLEKIDNGMGVVTELSYSSTEKFRSESRDSGKDWKTFFPFTMHVLSGVQATDNIANRSSKTSFHYSNGVYDRVEREFRGFGIVTEIEEGDLSTPAIRRTHTFNQGANANSVEARRSREADQLKGRLLTAKVEEYVDQAWVEREVTTNEWLVIRSAPPSRDVFSVLLATQTIESLLSEGAGRFKRARSLGTDEHGNSNGQIVEFGSINGDNKKYDDFLSVSYRYAKKEIYTGFYQTALSEFEARDSKGELCQLTRYYYDGEDHHGLGAGKLGENGCLTRIEELVCVGTAIPNQPSGVSIADLGYHMGVLPDGNTVGVFRNKIRYLRYPTGQIEGILDPFSNLTRFEYDPVFGLPISMVNALGHKITAEIHEQLNAIAVTRDANGVEYRRRYDGLGRVTEVFRRSPFEAEVLVRHIRYSHGVRAGGGWAVPPNITVVIPLDGRTQMSAQTPLSSLEGDRNLLIQRTFFDGSGGVLQRICSADGDKNRFVSSAPSEYNCRGKPMAVHESYFCSTLSYNPSLPSRPPQYRLTYDYRGRIVQSARADGMSRQTRYKPGLVEGWTTDALSAAKNDYRIEEYDINGAIVALGETETVPSHQGIKFVRDTRGQLASIDLAGSSAYRQRIDLLGRVYEAWNSDHGKHQFCLNAVDRAVVNIDANNDEIHTSRLRKNRLFALDGRG